MPMEAKNRDAADRLRPVVPRMMGRPGKGFPVFTLVIPTWLAREISGTNDASVSVERLREYEFMPERTKDGILYKAIKLSREVGW